MFYIVREMEESTTEQTSQELDRTYKTVLDFVHEVQDALEEDPEFDLYGVCEADEVYVVAGEKGTKQASPRERGLKKRDAERSSQTNRQS
jgi:hypothetical protein